MVAFIQALGGGGSRGRHQAWNMKSSPRVRHLIIPDPSTGRHQALIIQSPPKGHHPAKIILTPPPGCRKNNSYFYFPSLISNYGIHSIKKIFAKGTVKQKIFRGRSKALKIPILFKIITATIFFSYFDCL